jgi:mono/diheme cytochrome c family protein
MLQRLLIEKMENRILVGVTMFLGMMVLIGWLAINEPGRMQAFEEQYLGRSIERGATLFANNCTTCHGPDGRGLTGLAPGLNNPVLFGHDYLADVREEAERLETAQTEFGALTTELAAEGVTDERKAEIETRLAPITEEFGENPTDAIAAKLAELDTQRTAFTIQVQSAIDKGYDPEDYSRLGYLGWGGTLEAFVHTTLISGRPVSESYWPNPMAAWSQTAGGPLRDDQIQDLTNYILNFNRDWTLEDLLAVNQFAIRPGQVNTAAVENPVGTDVAAILTQLETVTGDPNNGQTLYNGALACFSCHGTETIAPPTAETWLAVSQGDRLSDPALAGYTPDQYLVESIVAPQAYIVPGDYAGQMAPSFGERLDIQMLADILAYIKSFDQPQ